MAGLYRPHIRISTLWSRETGEFDNWRGGTAVAPVADCRGPACMLLVSILKAAASSRLGRSIVFNVGRNVLRLLPAASATG